MSTTVQTITQTIDPTAMESLSAGFRGALVGPDDPVYDTARAVWNGSIDCRPAVVARCAGVADILAAVRFARETGLAVAVRGGGHNVAGFGTCDGGLVIDLSLMKGIRVDPRERTATVEPGVLGGELDRETQAFGLATTTGVMSTTGVAGFTLGGGIGWLQRSLGLACDNLLEADIVTAAGDLVRAAPDGDEELYWGIRGGGGNFGIATSFTFRLHEVGPAVFSGLAAWPAEQADDVLRLFRDFTADAPDEVQSIVILRTAPPAPFLPESVHGKPIAAIAGCYNGAVEDGERAFAPLFEANPVGNAFTARPYTAFQAMFDGSWAPGFRNYWKAEYLRGLPDDAIETFASYAVAHTSPLSDFKIAQLGGAVSRVGKDATAYSYRSAPYILNINTRWEDPASDDRHIAHTREIFDAVQPHSHGGAYVNFMGEEGADRVRAAYGDETYERLRALKRRYDPENLFRLNQNIAP